ncbi:MAG: hypothetical protein WC445_01170 [Patescibacteria group bacterium]
MDSSKKSILVGFSLGIMAAILGFGIYFFIGLRTLTIQNVSATNYIVSFLASKYPDFGQAPQAQPTQPQE